jgi:hypothetical protein
MKSLICRLFGHQYYETLDGYKRCERCGRGTGASFITKDALAILRHHLQPPILGNKSAHYGPKR